MEDKKEDANKAGKLEHPEYIVGIGASAGGLEALERFFQAVQPHGNTAYIVVQHLSPDFRSMMGEILARLTELKIKNAKDGMLLEADTIYLNSPRTDLMVKGGKFQLAPHNSENAISRPVDALFSSISKSAGAKGIGVILSGTGVDGRIGAQEIANRQGLLITQDLSSALFGSMPEAANEAVPNSLQMTPEEMPEVIQDYIRDPEGIITALDHLPDLDLLTEETALSFFLSLLQRKFETDFTRYKPQTIIRRLERRMTLDKIDSLLEYARLAQQDDKILDQIYRELLIDVTQFFRDPESFSWLEKNVIPQMVLNKAPGDTLRIWIAACSSGQEAYSITILFLEEIERQQKDIELRVFASDVHQSSVSVASAGKYPTDLVAGVPYHLRQKYFDFDHEFAKVKKMVRQRIVFSTHDLLADPYFHNQDLITCRNMLIYIRSDSQALILKQFTSALNKDGYLFLGPSEHLVTEVSQYYETLSRHWRIFQKSSNPQDINIKSSRGYNIRLPSHLQEKPHKPSTHVYKGWEPMLLKALIPAGYVCTHLGELKEIYGRGKEYLNFSVGKVNLNLTELLPESLAIALRNGLMLAHRQGSEAKVSNIQLKMPDEMRLIHLRIVPFEQDDGNEEGEGQFYLVMLEEAESLNTVVPIDSAEISPDEFAEVHSLKLELAFTRENLQSSLEELETTNEEIQSSNEELTAANEELQSTNEELSSVNEELYTVNAEYQEQNRVLNQLFNDKHNLERASGVLTIFLDNRLQIREMTPACYPTFELIEGDIGRSITQFSAMMGLTVEELKGLTEAALEGGRSQVEITSQREVPMMMSVIPYQGERLEYTGVILHFVDLSVIREMEAENRQLHNINDTLPIWISFIDQNLKYVYANQYFKDIFSPNRDLVGRTVQDVLSEELFNNNNPYYQKALVEGNQLEYISQPVIDGEEKFAKSILIPYFEQQEQKGFFVLGIDVTESEKERRAAEHERQMTEALYASVVDHLPDMVNRFRPDDYTVTYANPESEKALPTLQVGSSILDDFPDKPVNEASFTKENFQEHVEKLLASGKPQTYTDEMIIADGSTRIVIWTDVPIFNSVGEIVEIQGIGRDITDLRQAVEKASMSQARYRSIVESLPNIVYRFQADNFIVTYANEAAARAEYLSAIGESVLDSFSDRSRAMVFKQHIARVIESGEAQTIEEREMSTQGFERVLLWTDTPIIDGSGNVIEIQSVGYDLTESLMAHDELEAVYRQLNAINNNLPVWIAMFDKDYKIRYMNQYYNEVFGIDIESCIGKPAKTVLGKEIFKNGKPYYDRAINGETVSYFNSVQRNGESLHAYTTLVPYKEQGEVRGFYVLALDVTEQERVKSKMNYVGLPESAENQNYESKNS